MLFQERVRERDLDNFLVEELFSSQEFLAWALEKFDQSFRPSTEYVVNLDKSPAREQDGRQTDVRIGWFDKAGDLKMCVLIESKVTADFQPGQAAAYRDEVVALQSRLGKDCARSLLVAPASRMANLAHDASFDAELSLEEIIGFLERRQIDIQTEELRRRLQVRIQLLEALCGKRNSSGWIALTVAEKRDFAVAYAELAAELLPDLRVRPSTDGPKAVTRVYEGLELEGLPRSTLRHEFGDGVGEKYANVQFPGCGQSVSSLRNSGLFEGTPFMPIQAGKSAAIRVPTPAVNPLAPFNEEIDKVRAGLIAIRELVEWLHLNSRELAEHLSPNSESPSLLQPLPTESDFKIKLMATYRECEKLGYRPTGMLQMIENHGAIETARRLITGPPSDGYTRLATLRRLDLSAEAIVQEEPWRWLFSEQELKRARARLR